MKIGHRGKERAPHKPLLLLLALRHLRQGHARMRPYREIAFELGVLLTRFGPPRRKHHPEYPFQRLPGDGLWEIQGLQSHHWDRSGQLRPHLLQHSEVKGGLPSAVHHLLMGNSVLLKQTVEYLLQSHFPDSFHQDLLEAVALQDVLYPAEWDEVEIARLIRPRDPRFRANVIRAYEYRCAICEYDIRLDNHLMGLEAAHIRWHSSGGPDEVPNGLALCVIHHRAFDRGGIGLSDNLDLLVSSELHGQNEAWDFWFQKYEGQTIRMPRLTQHGPLPEYLNWHRQQVFRGAK